MPSTSITERGVHVRKTTTAVPEARGGGTVGLAFAEFSRPAIVCQESPRALAAAIQRLRAAIWADVEQVLGGEADTQRQSMTGRRAGSRTPAPAVL
jgi:hypothetical protein